MQATTGRTSYPVLLIILAFNYVDRLALGLLLQDIKVDLDLSDTQLGFLSGIAFALFYSVMGIPIARWADRGNRVTIITITTALWSAAVALCGHGGEFRATAADSHRRGRRRSGLHSSGPFSDCRLFHPRRAAPGRCDLHAGRTVEHGDRLFSGRLAE